VLLDDEPVLPPDMLPVLEPVVPPLVEPPVEPVLGVVEVAPEEPEPLVPPPLLQAVRASAAVSTQAT